jgi:Ca2+-transporting ATPase
VLATELPGLQEGLLTEPLTGRQWFACLGLAALLPLVIEARKWLRRRRAAPDQDLDVRRAVASGVSD